MEKRKRERESKWLNKQTNQMTLATHLLIKKVVHWDFCVRQKKMKLPMSEFNRKYVLFSFSLCFCFVAVVFFFTLSSEKSVIRRNVISKIYLYVDSLFCALHKFEYSPFV